MPNEPRHLIDNLEARRVMWHEVWDWIIRECERLAAEAEQRQEADR